MDDLKKLNIKKHYDSESDDMVNDFFIPVLKVAKNYKRLAGFFSSGIFSVAAKGIVGLIEGGGHMQLLIGANLHEDDANIIKEADSDPDKYLERALLNEIETVFDLLTKEHVEALGWLLANDLLEIRVGIVKSGALFHMKVGLIVDHQGNKLSFSGSDNETPSGWKHNIEEFKVFREWVEGESDYYLSDHEKFERYWNGKGPRVRTVPLPEAVKEKLIKISPKHKKDLKVLQKEKSTEVIPDYISKGDTSEKINLNSIKLRDCQSEALKFWKSKQYCSLLAMATGAGKTFTALMAYNEIYKKFGECLVIVAVPQLHLATQWIEDDIKKLYPEALIIEAHSDAEGWREKVKQALNDYSDGFSKQVFIVTLYSTLSSSDFLELFIHWQNMSKQYMFIADEVHNLGAKNHSKGMIESINIRLGLSATPARYFDEEGTSMIKEYFGETYEYSISDAIKDKVLVPYDYYPIFVEMSESEFEKYKEICYKISKNQFKNGSGENTDSSEYINYLYRERVKIVKKCKAKLSALRDLLIKLKSEKRAKKMLIYCDSLEQVVETQEILNALDLKSHKVTEIETKSQRNKIINSFSDGNYDVLVAVKILDEGVNVPSVETAIIQASSTNPREYIQRRGRVLRKSKETGKTKAVIYDYVVLPPSKLMEGDIRKIEQNILKREISRVQDFYNTANNKDHVMSKIVDKLLEYNVYLD